MTETSLGRKKKRVTYTASPQGIEKAENALRRLGFESKANFAESQLLARTTVTKFFQRQQIQLDSFKRICDALKLNWKEIAGIIEESEQLVINDCRISNANEEVEQVQRLRRTVTITNEPSQTTIASITLKGDIHSVQNRKILESILREYSGYSIKIIDIQEGSIILIIEGSQDDIQRLVSQIESGELTEVDDFPIENVQILSSSSDLGENAELDYKWRLVQEIVSQPVEGRDLRDADLSDTDLSNADLSNADLSNADLRGADLSDADLRGADLSDADLSDADLSNINLSYANLNNADLSGAILSNANLKRANLIGANLKRANLIGADHQVADLMGANLMGADLMGASLERADLMGASLERANLMGANLTGANLTGANLTGANLERAVVKNARFRWNKGLTKDMKLDLKRRGAIFEDSPGDRFPISRT